MQNTSYLFVFLIFLLLLFSTFLDICCGFPAVPGSAGLGCIVFIARILDKPQKVSLLTFLIMYLLRIISASFGRNLRCLAFEPGIFVSAHQFHSKMKFHHPYLSSVPWKHMPRLFLQIITM